MNNKQQWSTIMQASDERRSSVRGPLLAGIIAGLHVAAISGFLVIQGCGTKEPMVEPPPARLMPPRDAGAQPSVMPRPSFQPPAGVEQAPMTIEEASVRVHTVAGGESLARIANRYGVSVNELVKLNGIKDPNKIRVGQTIKLPSYASESAAPAPAPAAKPVKPKAEKSSAPAVAGDGVHVVQSGDSLSKIAARQGTTVKALKEVNNLQSDVIRIGQKLKLPVGAKPSVAKPAPAPAPAPAPTPAPTPVPTVPEPSVPQPEAPAPAPITANVPAPAPTFDAAQIPFEYTVRPGETIDDIARNFAVLRQDVLSMNGLSDGATVSAGQKLKIPMSAP